MNNAVLALVFASLGAGSSPPESSVARSSSPATFRWNEVARALVRKNYVDPLWAVRTYALVSIAQHDALHRATRSEAAPGHDPAFMSVVVAASSAAVLVRLYPHEVPRLAADLERDVGSAHALSKAALDLAVSAGESAGRAVLDERENDGALSLDTAVPPAGAGRWRSSERWPALRPSWGRVRPFLIRDVDAFAVPPPPPLESEPFRAALADVREHTRRASARLSGIAKKWADGPGTSTPAGHWNEIAVALMDRHRTDERESARLLALLNMALMDASIVCWRAKFEHWLLRPPEADPQIVPTLPLPNFPSYPSGHAAFSGAASAFLARHFPTERDALTELAEEAALSRVVSGIHYPFDSTEGLRQGRRIAELAIAEYERAAPLAGARASESPRSGHNLHQGATQ